MTDTIPRLGQDPIKVDQPEPEDERHQAVTAVIGALDKPALVYWAAKTTAEAAVDQSDVWQSRLKNEGRGSAIDYLKGARFRRGGRLSAADLGTQAHGLFQQFAVTEKRPPVPRRLGDRVLHVEDVRALGMMLDQFSRFLDEFAPQYLCAEVAVFNRTYGFAGTADAFLVIDGIPLIADYKTSPDTFDAKGKVKGPYPEVALQLAAYRHAEFAAVWRARRWESNQRRYYLLNQTEIAMAREVPEADGGIAIYITPEHYAVHPVRCDDRVFEAFLYVQEAARWVQQGAPRAVGAPMIPPHPREYGDPFAGLPQEG